MPPPTRNPLLMIRDWLGRRAMTRGKAAAKAGDLERALKLFQRAAHLAPHEPQARVFLGNAYRLRNQLAAARAQYEFAITLTGAKADAYANLVRLLRELGERTAAEEVIDRWLIRWPDDVLALDEKANSRLAANDEPGAVAPLRRVLQLRPESFRARLQLALSAWRSHNADETLKLLHGHTPPENRAAFYHELLGHAYFDLGRTAEALKHYRLALELGSENVATVTRRTAECYAAMQDYPNAIDWLERTIVLNPKKGVLYVELAHALAHAVGHEDAQHCYRRGLAATDDAALELARLTCLPPIIESTAAIDAMRLELEKGLEAFTHRGLTSENPMMGFGQPFYLAFHGRNDRALMTRLAQIYLKTFPTLHFTAAHCERERTTGNKDRLRIGFVSRFLRSHSVGFCFRRMVEYFARHPRFETYAIGPEQRIDNDPLSTGQPLTYVAIDVDIRSARETIAALELDVLIYLDIGMDPLTYFLAYARLAPLQCVMAGHPVTTGIPTCDYYISSALMEPPSAQTHYSEELLLLSDGLAVYPPLALPSTGKTRADFGWSETDHIYLIPSKLQKLHPAFDHVLARILQLDPTATLVFFADRTFPLGEAQLRARWRHVSGLDLARMVFQPWLPFQDFHACLAHADVVLDTFPFGLGTTATQALMLGVPIITGPSEFLGGRITAGLYRQMKITDAIADTPEDMADRAVRCATDAEFRHDLVRRIMSAKNVLADNYACCDELAAWFENRFDRNRLRTT